MKKVVKRVMASLLAVLLIVTMLPTVDASAAAKKPSLSAKTKTVTVGKTIKLTVKNKVKGSTYKWSAKNPKIVRVSQKGVVRGLKAGKTSVVCQVKTAKKNYKLACTVTVKNAPKTSEVVGTQAKLEAALKNTSLKKLTIQTEKEVTLNIPKGDYSKVALTVDAPNADINNSGVFKSIDIKAIKSDTWNEKAKGNSIKITTADARIVVEKGASLANVSVTQEGGKIKIEASGTIEIIEISAPVIVDLAVDGKIGEVAVKAAAVVSVEGKTTEAIAIKVDENAKGATLSSSAPVDVKAAADISLTLSKGAEGSKVEATGEKTNVAIKNDTTEAIKVTTSEGVKEVAKDTSSKVSSDGSVSDTSTSNPGYSYTSPDPLKLQTIMVKASKQIAIYFNQTVPAQISVGNITVKNEAGVAQEIAAIERHSQDTQAYFVEFVNTLETDTYTVEMNVSGTKFSDTFVYNAEDWKYLDAAKAIVEKVFTETCVASVTGLTHAEVCRMAFEEKLIQAINADENAKKVNIRVQTRPFKYEEFYPDQKVLEGHAMVSIWIGADYGDANFMMNKFVDFDCSGEEFVVSGSAIVAKLKNSVVVQYESGYQFACAKSDVSYKDIPEDAWRGYSDYMGNIEFKDLEAGTEYKVYKRLANYDGLYSETEVTLLESNPEIQCIMTGAITQSAITVVSGSSIQVKAEQKIKRMVYGKAPEGTQVHGWLNCKVGEKNLNFSNWKFNEDGTMTVLLHWSDDTFQVGENTITCEYRLVCSGDGKGQVATSEPIIFEILVTVTENQTE